MRKSIVAVAVSTALLMGGVNLAQAKPHGFMGMQQGGPKIERLARALDLTDEQVAQLDEAMSAKGVEMRQIGRAAFSLGEQLNTLDPLAADYQAKVEALKSEASTNAAQMVQMRADQQKILADVLTPEQLTKLQQLKEEKAKRFGERDGKHGGKHGEREFRGYERS
ncbi:MAG: Spy/CpxP family protein refolding chaperone [Pontibacterium sp.]